MRRSRNFARGYSAHWGGDAWFWVEVEFVDPNINMHLYSAENKDDTPYLEDTRTRAISGYVAATFNYKDIICRSWDDNIWYAITCSWDTTDFPGEWWVTTIGGHTNDGGLTDCVMDTYFLVLSTGDYDFMFVIDLFQYVADRSYLLVTLDNGAGSQLMYMYHGVAAGGTANSEDNDTLFTAKTIYSGNLVEDTDHYQFIYKDDGGDWRLCYFDISTTEFVDGATFTMNEPTTFDTIKQQYIIQSGNEILLDAYYFRFRSINETTWSKYTASSPTLAILALWEEDFTRMSHFIWDNAIWEITDKGVLKKIQALEPRDYKKVYLSNINENLTGVVQFHDRNGNDAISAWITSNLTSEISYLTSGHNHTLLLTATAANGSIYYPFTTDTDSIDDIWVYIPTAHQFNLKYRETTTEAFSLSFLAGNITVTDAGGTSGTVATYTYAKWIHINLNWIKSGALNITIDSTLAHTGTVGAFDINRIYMILATDATYCVIDSFGQGLNSYVSGSNKKINAYVGSGGGIDEAWFSTGDGTSMNLSFKDYTSGTKKSLVISELYKPPQHTLIRRTPPFEDEWVKEYTDAGVLFYEGKVKNNNNDNRFYWKYLMKSWEDEYADTKITANLVGYTHKAMLEYVLDNFSKYLWEGRGTNANVNTFTATQIAGTDTNWTNTDGVGCASSYVAKKGFANDFLYDILQQLDNGAGVCLVEYAIAGNLVYSGWFASSDVTQQIKIEFYESATRIGYIEINASKIRWYNGSAQDILDPAVNATDYHWALVFSADDDDVDVYINGVFISTQSLENNITTEITKIRYTTDAATTGPTGYHSNLYVGISLVDAMHTYSSISPLLITTYDFNLKSQSLPLIQKLIAEETGYIVSVRPSGQVYVDQYGASGQLINVDAAQGITYLSKMKVRNEKFSYIKFYGGYVAGVQIDSEGFGEPNFGSYEDWFPMITDQARLDAMIVTALANRNITIKKMTLGKRGVGPIYPGTSLTFNVAHYKVAMETWNCWRKNKYNGLTDNNRVEIADSFLSPSKADPEDDRDSQVDAAIGTNADNIVKVEQTVGQNAEDIATYKDHGALSGLADDDHPQYYLLITETRYLSINAAAIRANTNADNFSISDGKITINAAAGITCPVNLPHGATVTEFDVFSSTAATETHLLRRVANGTITFSDLASVATLGNAVDTTIATPVVDNANYNYYIRTTAFTSGDIIYGYRIIYTITEPLP